MVAAAAGGDDAVRAGAMGSVLALLGIADAALLMLRVRRLYLLGLTCYGTIYYGSTYYGAT